MDWGEAGGLRPGAAASVRQESAMRPWVPEAPPRPRRRRGGTRGAPPPRAPRGVGEREWTDRPEAGPLAGPSADDAALRRRIAERCAVGEGAESGPLQPVIEQALAEEAREALDRAARRPPPWRRLLPGGSGDTGPGPAPPSPALQAERARALDAELAGFGPLTPWVGADGVTDVLVDGAGAVWTDGA